MSENIKFAFSSQISPSWDFADLLAKAKELGFDGVTLTAAVDDPAARRKQLVDAGLKVASIASRITPTLSKAQDQQLRTNVRQLINQAAELGAASVRVLDPLGRTGQSRADLIERTAEWLLPLADDASKAGVMLLVQNANALNRSRDLWALLDYSVHPSLGAAWDQAAAWPETPALSIPTLNARLVLPILRDVTMVEGAAQWKNLGEGQLQVESALQRLKGIGHRDWVSFEMPAVADADAYLKDAITKLRDWTKPKEVVKPKPAAKPAAAPGAKPVAKPAAPVAKPAADAAPADAK